MDKRESSVDDRPLNNEYLWFVNIKQITEWVQRGMYQNFRQVRKLMLDGTISVPHRLLQQMLMSFCNNQHEVDIDELSQFLRECQIHQHEFFQREKAALFTCITDQVQKNWNWRTDSGIDKIWNVLSSLRMDTCSNISILGNHLLQAWIYEDYKKHGRLNEEQVMKNVDRIYKLYKPFDICIPSKLLQFLCANVQSPSNKEWVGFYFLFSIYYLLFIIIIYCLLFITYSFMDSIFAKTK
ncbi:hypothetical protein RFI_17351 [Reticulomyxa filosa]|uniref:Uncharacterized protein n=1 Tax=Reticulomyxa filosa TaxID=46433 RepID=X6N0V9_RETFI|nr:hypothetical protein RFI_17351 [Reticulomyxa filosa]|eukprot:ETO19880.1 hypothetical protein RFI_17351 [Reticulomyxa filosa]